MELHSTIFFFLVASGYFVLANSATLHSHKAPSVCGYDGCPKGKEGVINVHVVPHTHDDVGWLKTVDQYYFGSSTRYQKAGVGYILDSVVRELEKDPERRFIYVEMAFFWQWWKDQTEDKKNLVRQLVQEGRLEFINGGWCMNDEAATHYNDIIDQMTWGLRFLNDTFGECGRPRIAWQIDPFGHSREQANLFALMGFDGVFFGRIDWEDRSRRRENKTMEMVWQASNSLGERGSLFTGVFYDHYSAPPGFCFDVKCSDTPFIDSEKSADYNVPQRVKDLVTHIKKKADSYPTNHIMLTMGDDFNYMTADMNFKNMDKMIRYTNALEPSVNLFYSTPSCYVKALNEAGITWTTKTDDFFPYSNDPHAYWTGYFTSRPTFKGSVRTANTFLQSCKQLHSLANPSKTDDQELIDSLRRSMGEAQHHDAVAGTEKQHVSQDYRLRLHDSTVDCQKDVTNSFDRILRIGNHPLPDQHFCLMLNVSACEVTESNGRFVVTVYNPRSQEVTSYVRLPVTHQAYTVLDPDGSELVVQMMPLSPTALGLIASERSISSATHELVFQAAQLPPLGHKSFYVVNTATQNNKRAPKADNRSTMSVPTTVRRPRAGEKVAITNERVTVNFGVNGLLESVSVDGRNVQLTQNLMWYAGMNKGHSVDYFENRASGAYVFRPNGTDASPIATEAEITFMKGPIVEEVHQKFSDWASQVVRVYKGRDEIEIEWTVGPIPVDDNVGKEIVNRISTDIATNGKFYTDSNGRQTLERQRDFRLTWPLNVTEPVSENYYPINSHIYATDADSEVVIALVNDRAQGGTSLQDGQIELMVHRRLLYDDEFGVSEPLNDPGDGPGLIVKGTHYLLVNPSLGGQHPMSAIRPLTQSAFMKPWLSFSITDLSFTVWKFNFLTQKSGLREPLPDNVHILTLEPWKDGTHLLRLEHVYDVGEHPTLAQSATVILDQLLSNYTISTAVETTLGGNQWISDSSRMQWKTSSKASDLGSQQSNSPVARTEAGFTVTLLPMEIKTFIITMSPVIS